MSQPVIETKGLSKTYDGAVALAGLDLQVPAGTVFGYLGPNGAGKSTTIRLLVGLISPTSGSATVLGHDVVTERREVHRHIGYLPGDFVAYRDLRADEYLGFVANLRGDVEPESIETLAKRFDLDLSRKIGALSHGNRQKVGIIQACMHKPPLLILDEPTSGLDPLMQHEFLDLMREFRDGGGTVLLSSHALSEVEAVADIVAIIRRGRLVMMTEVAELRRRARRRVSLTFTDPTAAPMTELRRVPSVCGIEVLDGSVELVVEGSMAELMEVAAPFGIERVLSNDVDLDDIFLQYYDEEPGGVADADERVPEDVA